MKKEYNYEITDADGATVATGACANHAPETAEQLLSEYVPRPIDIIHDRLAQGGWTYMDGNSDYSVTIK